VLTRRKAQRFFSFAKIQKREQCRDYLKTNQFLKKGFSANRGENLSSLEYGTAG